MTQNHVRRRALTSGILMMTIFVAACGKDREGPAPEVQVRGSQPNIGAERAGTNTLNNDVVASPDASGIITYDGYQSAIARNGDTVSDVAERVGLSATELGAYNGLPANHQLRDGDELVLPPRPGGYGPNGPQARVIDPASSSPTATLTTPPTSTISQQPLDDGTQLADATTDVPSVASQSQGASAAAAGVAVASEVADSIANPGATPTVTTPWSPDLAAAAIDRSTGIQDDGTLGAPPSSTEPTPPEPSARRELQSPDLSQYQTPESAAPPPNRPQVATAPAQETVQTIAPSGPSLRLVRPVSGPIAVGFNKGAGPSRNDGVDFAAAAGSPVVAAADGEVALVSQSLGGLGTIILVRHPNELLTVYGRVDGVSVNKGDLVRAGQRIGVVSNAGAPAEPRMHFEVRRGAESLDPALFL